eukprot:731364_1
MVKTGIANDYVAKKPNSSDASDDNPCSSLPHAKPSNTDTPISPPLDSSPSSQTDVNIGNADNIKQSTCISNDNDSNTSDTNIATKANRTIMNYHCNNTSDISQNAHAVKCGRKKRDNAKKKAVTKKKLSGKKRGNKSHNTHNVKRQRLNNGKAA